MDPKILAIQPNTTRYIQRADKSFLCFPAEIPIAKAQVFQGYVEVVCGRMCVLTSPLLYSLLDVYCYHSIL